MHRGDNVYICKIYLHQSVTFVFNESSKVRKPYSIGREGTELNRARKVISLDYVPTHLDICLSKRELAKMGSYIPKMIEFWALASQMEIQKCPYLLGETHIAYSILLTLAFRQRNTIDYRHKFTHSSQ